MIFILIDKSNISIIAREDGKPLIFDDYAEALRIADTVPDENGLVVRIDRTNPRIATSEPKFEDFLCSALAEDVKNGVIDTHSGEMYTYCIELAPKTGREPEGAAQSYELTIHLDDNIINHYEFYNSPAEAQQDIELLQKLYDLDIQEI